MPDLLVGEEPSQDVLVCIKPALLVGYVIARARLLIQLGQTVCGLLEAVFKRDKVHLSVGLLLLMLNNWLLVTCFLAVLSYGLVVGYRVKVVLRQITIIVGFHDQYW